MKKNIEENTAAKNETKWEEEEEKKKENILVKNVVTNLESLKAPVQEGSDSLKKVIKPKKVQTIIDLFNKMKENSNEFPSIAISTMKTPKKIIQKAKEFPISPASKMVKSKLKANPSSATTSYKKVQTKQSSTKPKLANHSLTSHKSKVNSIKSYFEVKTNSLILRDSNYPSINQLKSETKPQQLPTYSSTQIS